MSDNSQNRTEQPTPRKLQRSREKGQVGYSADFISGISLLLSAVVIAGISDWFMSSLQTQIVHMLTSLGDVQDNMDVVSYIGYFLENTGYLCLPVLGVSFFTTLLFGGALTGFGVAPKAFELDFNKLNPVQGWSKIFSSRSVVRALMAIIKLTIISVIVMLIVRRQTWQLGLAAGQTVPATVFLTIDLVVQLLVGVAAAMVVLGVADLAFQKWKHLEEMKMSLQEVRDERKEDDGDPHMRARIRRLQREISQSSLQDSVSSATVVVTNPTHFAVALKYDRDMNAPVVVAKGKDFLALRIMDIAKLNDVPVVQRKPLARALYHNVEIGGEIPVDLYQLVAEVLTFIHTIDRQVG